MGGSIRVALVTAGGQSLPTASGSSARLWLPPQADGVDGGKVSKRRVLPCTLDKTTQDLVALIFSSDMFRDAMKTMNIGRRCWVDGESPC